MRGKIELDTFAVVETDEAKFFLDFFSSLATIRG